jgi:hypothetical protein
LAGVTDGYNGAWRDLMAEDNRRGMPYATFQCIKKAASIMLAAILAITWCVCF